MYYEIFHFNSYCNLENSSLDHTTAEKFENGGLSLLRRIECFPSTLRRRNLRTKQSLVILYLCLRKTRSGESHDYRDVIVFKKLVFKTFSVHTKTKSRRFQIPPVRRQFSKSSVFVADQCGR